MNEKNKKKPLFKSPYDEAVEPLRLDDELSYNSFLIDKLSDEELLGLDESEPTDYNFDPSRVEFEGFYADGFPNAVSESPIESKRDVEENEEDELNYSLYDSRVEQRDKTAQQRVPQVDAIYEQIVFANAVSSLPASQNPHQVEWKARLNDVSNKYVSEVDKDGARLDGANFQQILKPVTLLRNLPFI